MMKTAIMTLSAVVLAGSAMAQQPLTPERLWQLGRLSVETLTPDQQHIIYGVSKFDLVANSSTRTLFTVPVFGGDATPLLTSQGGGQIVHIDSDTQNITYLREGKLWRQTATETTQLTPDNINLQNVRISPDGQHVLYTQAVPLINNQSADRHPDLPQSNAYVYDQLHYRHWDSWTDGKFHHVFYAKLNNGQLGQAIDIMEGEPYHTPQQPFGGMEDVIWSPDSERILYVSKKKYGTAYALSTNTDIYQYDLGTGQTTNLTEGMMGYDTSPSYSPDGQQLAWLSMKEEGYEADKNDIIVFDKKNSQRYNLTKDWDGTVNSFQWAENNRTIWFTAAVRGTIQLFELSLSSNMRNQGGESIKQLSNGQHDITGIIGQSGQNVVVTLTTMNRASELYRFDTQSGSLTQISQVNDEQYNQIATSKVEPRITKASDGKELFSWIIYPPNFDPNKKYPTLLYCQGGPQSALTQFYSFRWNMQLIAAQGYIVVAPNRRGMPGHGVAWNEQISGDWGGQPMRDYLTAIDDIANETYVDSDRLGAIGASFGGYSVFMLAGIHENRFKTFISHNGLFDMTSWYGTTEELFFANKDLGGPYWDQKNTKTYNEYNPIKYVDKWNTPMLIIQGGRDYRVSIEQGLEAFQAAQLNGVKSRLLYLPDENHWVLSAHNALVWQREFFKWLTETL